MNRHRKEAVREILLLVFVPLLFVLACFLVGR